MSARLETTKRRLPDVIDEQDLKPPRPPNNILRTPKDGYKIEALAELPYDAWPATAR